MFCTNCGYEAENADSYCSQCGAKLERNVGRSNVSPIQLRKVMGIVGAALAIVIILALILPRTMSPHSSPERVVLRFLEAAYEEGNISKIFDLLDPVAFEEIQAITGTNKDEVKARFLIEFEEEFSYLIATLRKELEAEGAWFDYEIVKTKKFNGGAQTTINFSAYHPHYGHDEHLQTFHTVKRNGRWYMDMTGLEQLLYF